jgi:hypothetical protein
VLSTDLEDGLTLEMTTKLLILTSWNQFGMSLSSFSIKVLSIEEEKLCLIQMAVQQFYRTSRFNKIINKSVILRFMLTSHWSKILMLNLWFGPLHHGHYHQI